LQKCVSSTKFFASKIVNFIIFNKTVVQALVAASVLSSGAAFAEYKEVKRLGTSQAVCKGGVESAAQFQAWTASNTSVLNAIVADAGLSSEVATAISSAVAKGEFAEKQYAPGTKLTWMGSVTKGKAKALPKRIWAGKAAFAGYEMFVTVGDSTYEIVVPKACCNFSLVSIATVEKKVAVAPVVEKKAGIVPFLALIAGSESLKRYEPVWDINVQDTSGYIGAKLGAKIPVGEGLNLVPAIGLVKRTGVSEANVYPESSANLDLGIEKTLANKMFIGAGVGAYNVNKSDFRDN